MRKIIIIILFLVLYLDFFAQNCLIIPTDSLKISLQDSNYLRIQNIFNEKEKVEGIHICYFEGSRTNSLYYWHIDTDEKKITKYYNGKILSVVKLSNEIKFSNFSDGKWDIVCGGYTPMSYDFLLIRDENNYFLVKSIFGRIISTLNNHKEFFSEHIEIINYLMNK